MGQGSILTMKDLGRHIRDKIGEVPGDREVYERLLGNPENNPENVEVLLTYLYQYMPWKDEASNLLSKSAFITLTEIIADYITQREKAMLSEEARLPEWSSQLANYLHKEKITVVTFNYDTILERISAKYIRLEGLNNSEGKIRDIRNFYGLLLIPLISLSGNPLYAHMGSCESYKLLKLHGSINWYFSGDENLPSQNVYYSDEISTYKPSPLLLCYDSEDDPINEESEKYMEDLNNLKLGFKRLIIPPVAGKEAFYNLRLLRVMWRQFFEAATKADEIYCVGYSLPITDLQTRIFFSTAIDIPGKKVYLVNRKCGSKKLIDNYKQVLRNCELVTDYILDDKPIQQMVKDLAG